MRMNETERVLLQLTGRALFNAPADFDPAMIDWFALYQEAASQALTLLIWDTFTDDERARIPNAVTTQWEQNSLHRIMKNEQLLYEQEQVIRLLDEADIPCVILKGSSSAAYYPNPILRVMGDIDILVRPEQQKAAVEILQVHGYGGVLDENHHCHLTISKGGITVEVHKEPNGLFMNSDKKIACRLQDAFADAVDRRQFVNGLPFLADDQQALVLILHKLEHFMTSGLGLRQMCDWAVFVSQKLDENLPDGRKNWAVLKPLLSDLGLLTFTGIMTKVCVDYFGLPESRVPWVMEYDKGIAEKVIAQILKEGNFGSKAEKYGERLFNDPNSSNRISSFINVLRNTCRSHWPVCNKHKVLMPVAPFVLLGKYIVQRQRGERPKLDLRKKYQQAGYDQKLYKELKPFVAEQEN